jgi:polysaccharide export outer membrane protein
MGGRVAKSVRIFSCAAALGLAGCSHSPDTVISAALSNIQGHAGSAVYGEIPTSAPDETVTWGAPAVYPAALEGSPASGEGPYLLDTGDRLRVFVYGQPNLSRAYTVDQEGRITVPLIGNVEVRGRTTGQVQGAIKHRLGIEYVRDPQVTVDIIQNRPFFIYGEVRTGGQFPYVSGMTVETAIAIAGGYTERASTRSYRVSRRVNGFVDEMVVPADFPLQPGDTVYVKERFF